jgi:hypothetical protein
MLCPNLPVNIVIADFQKVNGIFFIIFEDNSKFGIYTERKESNKTTV